MPERILLSRARGWRLPPGAVSVARPGRWGNPFRLRCYPDTLGERGTRAAVWAVIGQGVVCFLPSRSQAADVAVALYRKWLSRPAQAAFLAHARLLLHGKDLACWCELDGSPCHADVLLEIANR